MKGRPVTDPRSWRYQAAIHGWSAGEDPSFTLNEALVGGMVVVVLERRPLRPRARAAATVIAALARWQILLAVVS
jgi:hypothetical protein